MQVVNPNPAASETFITSREPSSVQIDGGTVNGQVPSTAWQRFWFKFALTLQTLMYPMYRAALLAQAEFETGEFTSYGFAKRKNPFGMRPATVRPNSQDGESGGYATYKSYWNAVKDRIQWDKYNSIKPADTYPTVTYGEDTTTPVEGYMQDVIDHDYAEDPQYLTKWIEQYDGEKSGAWSTIVSFVLVGITITIIIMVLRRIFKRKPMRTWKRSRWGSRRNRKG